MLYNTYFRFAGGDWIVQRKPFGRAQRYLLHLLVRSATMHENVLRFHLSYHRQNTCFLFCLLCVYRVTVGVVIGVADLILPDKNMGEVGRKSALKRAQHFST